MIKRLKKWYVRRRPPKLQSLPPAKKSAYYIDFLDGGKVVKTTEEKNDEKDAHLDRDYGYYHQLYPFE